MTFGVTIELTTGAKRLALSAVFPICRTRSQIVPLYLSMAEDTQTDTAVCVPHFGVRLVLSASISRKELELFLHYLRN